MLMQDIMIVNVIVVIVMLLFLSSGYQQGFLWKLISILGFFVVGWLAWMLSDSLSGIIALYPKEQIPMQGTLFEGILYDSLNRLLVFALLFILFEVLLLLLKPIAKLAEKVPVVSTVNKVCGLLLGGVQGILVLSICALLLSFPFYKDGKRYVQESLLQYSAPLTTAMWGLIKEPVMDLAAFQKQSEDVRPLQDDEKKQLREWLLDKNIDKESVDALLEALR